MSGKQRVSHQEKVHALNAARNPGDSKYGNALYKSSTISNRAQSAELLRIEKQCKRSSMHIDQEKKQFLQRYSQKEPILIVVRPPSPTPIRDYESRQYNIEHDLDYGDRNYRGGPRYMEPLGSKDKIPNFRPTIDAFCVQTKKKVNVWEHVILDKETPKFRSTVQPSYPISKTEYRDLVRGMEYHKLELEAASRERLMGKENQKKKKKKRKKTPRALPAATGIALPETSRSIDLGADQETPTGRQWEFVTEASPQSILTAEQVSTGRETDRTRFKLPDLTPRASITEDAGSSRCSSGTPPDSLEDAPQGRSAKRRPRPSEPSDKDVTLGRRVEPRKNSKGKRFDSSPRKARVEDIPEKTTAICIVYGEDQEERVKSSDTDDVTMTSTSHDAEHDDVNTGELNDANDHLDPNDCRSNTPQRKKSGLSVILEAALEGMGDASPRQ